jgi:hypothetical protein
MRLDLTRLLGDANRLISPVEPLVSFVGWMRHKAPMPNG